MVEIDDGSGLYAELLEGEKSAMPLDDFRLAVLVVPHGDGVAIPEGVDARGDFVDLFLGVLLGVVCVGHEVGDG